MDAARGVRRFQFTEATLRSRDAYLLETTILASPDGLPLTKAEEWNVERLLADVDRLRLVDPRKARRMAGLCYVCGRERQAHAHADSGHAGVATAAMTSSNSD